MKIDKLLHAKECNQCSSSAIEIDFDRKMIDGEDRDVCHADGTLAPRITDALRTLLTEWDEPWRCEP